MQVRSFQCTWLPLFALAAQYILISLLIDSASSAVRNLHNYEIKGRRLRVDFSNEGGADEEDGDNVGDPHHFNISLRTQT